MGFEISSGRAKKSLTINHVTEVDENEDYWTYDEQCVIRVHGGSRRNLCTPFQCRGGSSMASLTPTRVTHGIVIDGKKLGRQDNSKCKTPRDADVGQWWAGRTVFIPRVVGNNCCESSSKIQICGLYSLTRPPMETQGCLAQTIGVTNLSDPCMKLCKVIITQLAVKAQCRPSQQGIRCGGLCRCMQVCKYGCHIGGIDNVVCNGSHTYYRGPGTLDGPILFGLAHHYERSNVDARCIGVRACRGTLCS